MTRPEVIAVGASLGGLAATRVLLSGLPSSFRCPVVLAQHRMADLGSRLVTLLASHSKLPVSEPDDKEPMMPGHVYVAPANYHLVVERAFFALSVDAPVLFARPSVDVLFESVADSYGAGAVGVMLTCSNEDGAAGAAAIKRSGGYLIVQDPNTAEAPDAVRAVLARTQVDDVLPIERIAARLHGLCGSP